jgi:hypothetical protein
MTIQWTRDTESNTATIARLGTRGTLSKDVPYIVLGAATEDEIHVAANAYISTVVPTWTYPNQPSARLLAQSYDVDYLGDDAWRVTIHYEKQGADNDNQQSPLKRSRSFDTSGHTEHTTQIPWNSESDVRKFTAAGGEEGAKWNEHPIGWDGEKLNGVDLVSPSLTWTEVYDVPSSYVTNAYIKQLAAFTGTKNDAAFRSFAAGEVLFLGANGSHDWDTVAGDSPWRLQYKFEARPNQGNTGDAIPSSKSIIGGIPVNKKGHDYLWVRYATVVTNNRILPSAEAIYVVPVYRSTDFSLLGIGTT